MGGPTVATYYISAQTGPCLHLLTLTRTHSRTHMHTQGGTPMMRRSTNLPMDSTLYACIHTWPLRYIHKHIQWVLSRATPQARDERTFCCLQRSHGCILLSAGARTNWHICKGWICTVDYLSFSDSFLTFQMVTKEEGDDISFSLLREWHTAASLSFLVKRLPHIIKGNTLAWYTECVWWATVMSYLFIMRHIDVLLTTNQLWVLFKICNTVQEPYRQIGLC